MSGERSEEREKIERERREKERERENQSSLPNSSAIIFSFGDCGLFALTEFGMEISQSWFSFGLPPFLMFVFRLLLENKQTNQICLTSIRDGYILFLLIFHIFQYFNFFLIKRSLPFFFRFHNCQLLQA